MYLAEALVKLRNLKSKAARIDRVIDASAVFYEDQKADYDYATELVERQRLAREILTLKVQIQLTNATTVVTYGNRLQSLAALILENAHLRTEMAFLDRQMQHNPAPIEWVHARTRDDVRRVLAPGCDKVKFRAEVDRLEQEKEELERVLAHANATTLLQDLK